jgi:hypothetical protein
MVSMPGTELVEVVSYQYNSGGWLKKIECALLNEPYKKVIVLQEVTSVILANGDSENRTFSTRFSKKAKKTIDKLDFFCKFINVDINYFASLDLEEGSAYGSHESPMDIEMGNVFFLLCPSGKSRNLNLGRKERKLY